MLTYQDFVNILNKHIFDEEKFVLLTKVADYPERFIGLFRPTKPGTKILQNLLQSHEIRFGDALEELIEKIFEDLGYKTLQKSIPRTKNVSEKNKKNLALDQFFVDPESNTYYFIEQKVRDDHDSSKKRGQINNFEEKLDEILEQNKGKFSKLVGIMYFIDPDLSKNKNYYEAELETLKEAYSVDLYLFYGKELFDHFNASFYWDQIITWLTQWKQSLPDIPEIDFDKDPQASFQQIQELPIRYWRKLLTNEKLWEEGIIKVLFKTGDTLKLVKKYFDAQELKPYSNLSKILEQRLQKYYP